MTFNSNIKRLMKPNKKFRFFAGETRRNEKSSVLNQRIVRKCTGVETRADETLGVAGVEETLGGNKMLIIRSLS